MSVTVRPVGDGPSIAESEILNVYRRVEDIYGPSKALDALVTVLSNVAIKRLGREKTKARLLELAEKLP